MPRKRTAPHWSKSLFSVMRSVGKTQTRTAIKSARKTLHKLAVKPKAPRGSGAWTSGVALGPAGARRYQLLTPPGVRASQQLPLIVMLHGCGQDANAFALSTRMNALAVRERFMVLYPEQDRLANLQGCWNWYDTDSRRAFREAATILAAIDQVGLLRRVDPARIAVAGLSAGASMAALLASRYPARFRAVAMHSGIPPGTAHSPISALRAMHGRAATAAPEAATPWPPLLVIHGSADRVVAPSNGEAAAQLWAEAAGARRTASRVVQRGQRRAMTLTDFKCRGKTAVTLCSVAGLGHAWSGGATGQPFSDASGPDASAMIWSFASRQFKACEATSLERTAINTNPSGLSDGGAGGLRHHLEIRRK